MIKIGCGTINVGPKLPLKTWNGATNHIGLLMVTPFFEKHPNHGIFQLNDLLLVDLRNDPQVKALAVRVSAHNTNHWSICHGTGKSSKSNRNHPAMPASLNRRLTSGHSIAKSQATESISTPAASNKRRISKLPLLIARCKAVSSLRFARFFSARAISNEADYFHPPILCREG